MTAWYKYVNTRPYEFNHNYVQMVFKSVDFYGTKEIFIPIDMYQEGLVPKYLQEIFNWGYEVGKNEQKEEMEALKNELEVERYEK